MNEFPDTATRRLSEHYTEPFVREMDIRAIEAELRDAAPGEAVEVPPDYVAHVDRHPLLAEREHTHGNFNATALIAQRFKDVSKNTPNWSGSLTDVQRESLEAIFTKIARILSGDPNHPDVWADIEGYAHLVIETLAPF